MSLSVALLYFEGQAVMVRRGKIWSVVGSSR